MSTQPIGSERALTVIIALMTLAAFASSFSLRISDPLLPQSRSILAPAWAAPPPS